MEIEEWAGEKLIAYAKEIKAFIECSGEEAVRFLSNHLESTKQPILMDNYPNPAGNETTISFWLPDENQVNLSIYDILGREVARLIDGRLPPGIHQVIWHSVNHQSGIFIYRLQAGDFSASKKMTLSNE